MDTSVVVLIVIIVNTVSVDIVSLDVIIFALCVDINSNSRYLDR